MRTHMMEPQAKQLNRQEIDDSVEHESPGKKGARNKDIYRSMIQLMLPMKMKALKTAGPMKMKALKTAG